jgi:hypothetical protein
VVMPYLLLFEVLEPFVETIGYVCLTVGLITGTLNSTLVVALALVYLFSSAMSVGSVLLEEITYRRYPTWTEVARLILYCFLEHLPYRQVHLVWRLRGTWQFLFGSSTWQAIERSGSLRTLDQPDPTTLPADQTITTTAGPS